MSTQHILLYGPLLFLFIVVKITSGYIRRDMFCHNFSQLTKASGLIFGCNYIYPVIEYQICFAYFCNKMTCDVDNAISISYSLFSFFAYIHDFFIRKTVFLWVCHSNNYTSIAYNNSVSNIINVLVQDYIL